MSFFYFTTSKIGGLITSLGSKLIGEKIQELRTQRKMQRIVDDATDRIVEQLEGYLKSEGLSEEKMTILITELAKKLQILVDNPIDLFSGNLDGSVIFKQSHQDGKLPPVIDEENLGQFYSILFPQIAHFIAGSKIALEQWKAEGYREEFKRLSQLAEQIRAMNAKVAEIPSAVTAAFRTKESQESEALLREFAQTLLSNLLLRVDLSPLRAERALHGSIGDHFVIPAIRERIEQPELVFNEQSIFYSLSAPGARRILHGGAGIGKTTCSIWMQSRLLQQDPIRLTLLFRLRQIPNIEELSLSDLIKKQAGAHLKDSISESTLKRWFAEGRLITIFDGFDEIPEGRRDAVEKWLTDLSIVASKTSIIITSRPLQSKHLDTLKTPWQQWDLLPFDEPRIVEFIQRWHRHLPEGELSEAERCVDAKALAQVFFKDQSLKTLADTPLMLGTLLFVHHRDKQLPNGRVDLYERYISAMLGLRDSGLGIQARATKLTDREKRRVLAHIALYFQINGKEEIDDALMAKLLPKLLKELSLDEDADKLSAALCERTGLLQGPGAWSFMHKTIGEFLVAELIFEGVTHIPQIGRLDRKTLWDKRHEDRWTSIMFFWAGKTTPRELDEFISDLINQVNSADSLLALSLLNDQGNRLSTERQKTLIKSIIKALSPEDLPTDHFSACIYPLLPSFLENIEEYKTRTPMLRGLSRMPSTVALSNYFALGFLSFNDEATKGVGAFFCCFLTRAKGEARFHLLYNPIMLASTTFDIPGYEITEHRGLVRGIIVRSPTISQGILGGLNNIIGGKIGAYTKMCEQTRSQAYDDMEVGVWRRLK